MLSKTTYSNISYGTRAIQEFAKTYYFEIIQDNLEGYLLVKNGEEIYLWNYNLNKKYNTKRIKLKYNNKIHFKQIGSFDQNSIKYGNKIRTTALSMFTDKMDEIIGIGGEYYVYFMHMKYYKYYGMSNNNTIIEDGEYNCKRNYIECENKYVNYNKLETYIKLDDSKTYDVLINVSKINENILKYISKYKTNKIIIITCNAINIKILEKYVRIIKLTNIQIDKCIITICSVIQI